VNSVSTATARARSRSSAWPLSRVVSGRGDEVDIPLASEHDDSAHGRAASQSSPSCSAGVGIRSIIGLGRIGTTRSRTSDSHARRRATDSPSS